MKREYENEIETTSYHRGIFDVATGLDNVRRGSLTRNNQKSFLLNCLGSLQFRWELRRSIGIADNSGVTRQRSVAPGTLYSVC